MNKLWARVCVSSQQFWAPLPKHVNWPGFIMFCFCFLPSVDDLVYSYLINKGGQRNLSITPYQCSHICYKLDSRIPNSIGHSQNQLSLPCLLDTCGSPVDIKEHQPSCPQANVPQGHTLCIKNSM